MSTLHTVMRKKVINVNLKNAYTHNICVCAFDNGVMRVCVCDCEEACASCVSITQFEFPLILLVGLSSGTYFLR